MNSLLSKKAVAEIWGCSTRKVGRIMQKRAIAFVYIGGRVMFKQEDVSKFIEAHTIRARAV